MDMLLEDRPPSVDAPPADDSCSRFDEPVACSRVRVEELTTETAEAATLQVFEAMSAEARAHRFFGTTPRLSRSALTALTALDPDRHRAWVAQCGGTAVALVRAIYDRAGDVELAVEVADDHSGRGIGRRLVETALRHVGRDWQEAFVTLIVHPQNGGARGFFRAMGAEFTYDEGVLVGELATGADERRRGGPEWC